MSEDLLLIPGPITLSDKVLQAQSIQSLSHTHPKFISIFQSTLSNLRPLFKSTNPKDQPLVIAGSGTLGWDIAASNIIYPGDDVLLLSTGFFSDQFAEAIKVYGAKLDVLTAPVGDVVPLELIESKLKSKNYSTVVLTHVDTSTATVWDLEQVSTKIHEISPDSYLIVDGVCSVGVENIEFTKWGLDYVLSGSQKAIGAPAGLSIGFLSERAVKRALERPVKSSWFANLQNWIPILQNYEAGKPSYYATPAISLTNALKVSLEEILSTDLDQRFAQHHEVSLKFKQRLQNELGLKLVSVDEKVGANGLTAVYLPDGIKPADVLSRVYAKGIVLAGGIHKDIKDKYIRIGHMGVAAIDPTRNDLDRAFEAIKESLSDLGYNK